MRWYAPPASFARAAPEPCGRAQAGRGLPLGIGGWCEGASLRLTRARPKPAFSVASLSGEGWRGFHIVSILSIR
jgi:hypothetical protein